ncbi:MAG: hypothetical protein INQ03_25935 [Candidatus Heimdallarchaeota archaeon]|nr:hypothetical protein [Candidatus Heimdallarchaeota archaeon]
MDPGFSSQLWLLVFAVFSLVLGFIFNQIRILKSKYIFNAGNSADIGDLTNLHLLGKVKNVYGRLFTLVTPLSISWGIFGILLSLSIAYANYFNLQSTDYELPLLIWLLISASALAIIPIILITDHIDYPYSIENMTRSKLSLLLLSFVLLALIISYLYFRLPLLGIIVVGLISIPAFISAWFAGKFFVVFMIRQYFRVLGWDYIEGTSIRKGFFGGIERVISGIALILALLAPIMALNSVISVLLPVPVQERGGIIGIYVQSVLPEYIHLVIIFILMIGPLISMAIQPGSFLELTLNSEIYDILSRFDWNQFSSQSDRMKQEISLRMYKSKEMRGIILVFISFVLYLVILSIGGILKAESTDLGIGFSHIPQALKLVESPIILIMIIRIFRDIKEEYEIYDIAKFGYKEQRDITGWTFWVIKHMLERNYELVEKNLRELLQNTHTKNNYNVYFYLGLIHSHRDQHTEAAHQFRQSLNKEIKNADAWMRLGLMYNTQNRYEDALFCLSQAFFITSVTNKPLMNIFKSPRQDPEKLVQQIKEIDRDTLLGSLLTELLQIYGNDETLIISINQVLNISPDLFLKQ